MKKTLLVRLALVAMLAVVALSATGCGMKRDVVLVNADETAFAIPLSGDTIENQAQLYSEENLKNNKVTAKRVFVDYERVKTKSSQVFAWMRPWFAKVMVIKVSLKPVTRAWTADPSSGTSAANEALVAETKESIRLSAEFNCNAQVDEANAAKFVHNYYGKQLEEVIDTQVRPYAQQLFTEQAARYTMDEFLAKKGEITNHVREGVTKKFGDQGIRIMTLGMQGDIAWDPKIQDSIDARIRANNEMLANQARNKQKVEAAEAANREAKLLTGETAIRIRELDLRKAELENQADFIAMLKEKWSGNYPSTMLGGNANTLFNLPSSK